MISSTELSYTGVLLAVFANQMCLPLPSLVVLMAAGALSANGKMQLGVIVTLAVLGCLLADTIWFWLGRRWGSNAVNVLCRFSTDPRNCSRKARDKFRRHGLGLLCISKFVPGLDGLMPPLAGAEGVLLPRFLACDSVGSLLWSASYAGLGYIFSNQLEAAIHWTTNFATALAIAAGVPVVLYAGCRGFVLARMIRRLRLRRISPQRLASKLKSKKKVAVLDLLNFEKETGSKEIEAIPGALSVDPSLLRKSPQIIVPEDVEIILYCSSRRDIVSARVAVALQRIGIDKAWVLEGGLKAWREQGFPVSHMLEPPEIVAERHGIKLPRPSTPPVGYTQGTLHDDNRSSQREGSKTPPGCERVIADF